MDLNALRSCLVIAEEHHLTRAAERLQMAQPNLTRLMRKREEELGLELFDKRNKRRFALTPAGRVFFDEMTRLLPHYDQAAQGERDKLIIGSVPAAMLSTILPLGSRSSNVLPQRS